MVIDDVITPTQEIDPLPVRAKRKHTERHHEHGPDI